jgi:hypothetical protein
MAAVYTNVYLLDDPNFNNTLVFGTTAPVNMQDVDHNLALVSSPLATEAAQTTLAGGWVVPSPYHGQVFTDDLAPVERLIDQIIFSYVSGR